MHILIDIVHPADVNFYKSAIEKLKKKHRITVLVRPRGKLVQIAQAELDIPLKIVGKHYSSICGKMYGVFQRVILLWIESRHNACDVLTSFGGFYAAIVARILNKKSVIFYDDFEYKLAFHLNHIFSSQFVIPKILKYQSKKISCFNGYKELAYLYRFSPNQSVLDDLGLNRRGYIFVRQVASTSLNYRNQDCRALLKRIAACLSSRSLRVVYSVESDMDRELFPASFILQEPCKDIHSLIFYAQCVISSGDTVAREAALLGVPTIYIGNRNMRIHQELITLGRLLCPSDEDVISTLDKVLDSQNVFENKKESSWEDTSDVIIRHLEQGSGS